jgi:hypothetical protein
MCGRVIRHYALKQHRVLAGVYPVVVITEDCAILLEELVYNTIHPTLSVSSTVVINSALTGVGIQLIPEDVGYCRENEMLRFNDD